MAYKRKTEDEWWIESYYPGAGWSLESRESNYKEAKLNYAIYLKECGQPIRMRKVRVRKGELA